MSATVIMIPNIQLPFEQLLSVIRQLDHAARVQVARILAETEMDDRLAALIDQLAGKSPVDSLSDADIAAEVQAVRQHIA